MLQVYKKLNKATITVDNALIGESYDFRDHWIHMSNPTDKEIELISRSAGVPEDMIKAALDEEERAEMQLALDAINSIKRVQVAEYSGCDEDVRRKFDARLSRLLDRMDLLMEVCDGQDRVRMFGSVSGNGRYLNDFVIHVPTDGVLVCLYGRLDLEVISEIIEKEMQ